MKNILALLAVLLWSGLVQAAGFEDCTSGNAKGTISVGLDLCVDFSTSELDSDMLSVGKCPGFTVIYNSDDTGVEQTMTLRVMTCVRSTPVDVNNCTSIDDIQLTGADLKGEMYGASAKWIYLKGETDPVSTTPRAMVRCHW